jgi:predicted cupin superfamily sugar epimerase
MDAEQIIDFFDMKPLEGEGGYYVETYRAAEKLTGGSLPGRYAGQRSLATAILYLLTPDTFSAMHRLKSDEVFHFYLGDPVTILLCDPEGCSKVLTLGHDVMMGQRLQAPIPGGIWQGCFLNDGGKFALMGTTVAPGFEFDDFEAAGRDMLLDKYPDRRDLILRLTHG